MKTAAIFFVLATTCFFGSGNAALEAGSDALDKLKSIVTTTKKDLDRYGQNMVSNLNTKLSDLMDTELKHINGISDPVINDIQFSITAAKENGANAEHCLEPAKLSLREASLNATTELEQCKNTGLSTINLLKSNIDAKALQGYHIVNDLDAIALDCFSITLKLFQTCILLQIPKASPTVQSYKNTAAELKSTSDAQSSSALTTASDCNQSPTQKVRQTASDVRLSSNNCIASA